MASLTLEILGKEYPWSGDLHYLSHPDGTEARIFVDSLGDTYTDFRVIPEEGSFASQRVGFRAVASVSREIRDLRASGYGNVRKAYGNAQARTENL